MMVLAHALDELRISMSVMARRAEAIFELAISVIEHPEERSVREVRAMDAEIDAMELVIDRACMQLLLKDPMALDFRYVFSCSKIVKELERVGDQSKTIAKWALRLPAPVDAAFAPLVSKAKEALNTAVQALVESSVEKAELVLELEFEVDKLEDLIIEKSTDVAEAFVAKALERIGDLSTNIAENIIFSVDARDVRHGAYSTERPQRAR